MRGYRTEFDSQDCCNTETKQHYDYKTRTASAAVEVPYHPEAYPGLMQTQSVEERTHQEETSPCSEAVVVAFPLAHRQV